MTVTFVANYMNHHQLPFSLELQRLTNNGYTFVACDPLEEEKKILGYYDMNSLPFVIRTYETDGYEKALDKILNDDMVIFGSCPDEMVEKRASTGKPFIIYSERFFKKGTYRRFIPITYKKIYNRLLRFEKKDVSVICSSAYLPYDIKLLKGNFEIFKWGYFPQTNECDLDSLISKKKTDKKIKILWVARFIKLKHPEDVIAVAEKLRNDGVDFELNMVGVGPLEATTKNLIKKKSLEKNVKLLGSMSPEKVREIMDESNIFLFTSDFHEGWGAVMNESMNSACAVVASHAIGSVPFLLEHGKNGYIYQNGNVDDLYKKVKALCESPEKCEEMGRNAYRTITKQWCAENATQRLYKIIDAKINAKSVPTYESGPCSKAEVIAPKYRKDNYDKI